MRLEPTDCNLKVVGEFNSEYGDIKVLRNVGTYLQNHTVWRPRRL
jgi:hypothetical protein